MIVIVLTNTLFVVYLLMMKQIVSHTCSIAIMYVDRVSII